MIFVISGSSAHLLRRLSSVPELSNLSCLFPQSHDWCGDGARESKNDSMIQSCGLVDRERSMRAVRFVDEPSNLILPALIR